MNLSPNIPCQEWSGVAAFAGSVWIGSDDCRTTFLAHALELMGDGIGNENGLCESDESCRYTPNMGSYQGHGELVSAGAFTGGEITGVTLMKYATNGR